MSVLGNLKPEKVFYYFEQLCSVPHGSGNTKQISDMCLGFAKELGLRCRQDEYNNVIIWKDATPGYEQAPTVILQGHMDMVCTKTEDCPKDMAKEGLELMTDGVEVWAHQTSLGADNCIAVAMALAVLSDDSLEHPALEALFTTDEETGMDGAFGVDCSDLMGRRLLNLDSEEEGVFTVSCSGGARVDCSIPGELAPLSGEKAYSVCISGLLGGHSGGDIHLGRGNATILMGRSLYAAMQKLGGIRIASLKGGLFDNVICSRCDAELAVAADKATEFEAFIKDFDALLKNEYAGADAGVCLECAPSEIESAYTAKDSENMLRALFALPQGVIEVNRDFEGLTQTSLNLGIMRSNDKGLEFSYSVRSCIATQKDMMVQKLMNILALVGGCAKVRSAYPGWQFAKQSDFRDSLMAIYREQTGKDAALKATHGGLECGLFMEKMPGLDAVSLGPEMHDIHSVNEKVNVASVERVYNLVCELLRRGK